MVRYGLWAGLPTNLWADLPMAVRDGFCEETSGWGLGEEREWGEVAIATHPPPPTEICVAHTETSKISMVNANAWCFGPEDLVKTKIVIIV
jgi:hypothetical protein